MNHSILLRMLLFLATEKYETPNITLSNINRKNLKNNLAQLPILIGENIFRPIEIIQLDQNKLMEV